MGDIMHLEGWSPYSNPGPDPTCPWLGQLMLACLPFPQPRTAGGPTAPAPSPQRRHCRLAFKGNFRLLLQAVEDLVELLLELLAIPCQQAVFTGEPASLSTCRVFFSGSGGWREGQGENQDPDHRVWAGGLGGRQSPMRGVQGSGGTETQPDSH